MLRLDRDDPGAHLDPVDRTQRDAQHGRQVDVERQLGQPDSAETGVAQGGEVAHQGVDRVGAVGGEADDAEADPHACHQNTHPVGGRPVHRLICHTMQTTEQSTAHRRGGFFEGRYGRWLLPGVILQSVLIGGGYATGREIVEFGAKFGALGWIAGLAIFAGFGLMAFLMFEMARRFQVFDYRNLLRILIGPLYWLFDIVYIMLAILIIAIMAAATGSILQATLGTPQIVGIALIVVIVGLLNFYGEGVIERFKTAGTVA